MKTRSELERGTLRFDLLFLLSLVLALGVFEAVASYLTAEELAARDSLPAAMWLVR